MFIIIDVRCLDCDNIFEVSKKSPLEDFVMKRCPKCKNDNVKRIWGVGAVYGVGDC